MASLSASPPDLPRLNRSADELTTLTEMLDYYRTVLVRKASGLDEEQLATPLPPTEMTLGGLLLHMALVEDHWFDHRFRGNDEIEPWSTIPWDDDPDWEFHNAHQWDPSHLLAQFHTSVDRSRATLRSATSLDQLAALTRDDGTRWNLRWILVHLIEEYARHCGHGDLIRESIDGVTGD